MRERERERERGREGGREREREREGEGGREGERELREMRRVHKKRGCKNAVALTCVFTHALARARNGKKAPMRRGREENERAYIMEILFCCAHTREKDKLRDGRRKGEMGEIERCKHDKGRR